MRTHTVRFYLEVEPVVSSWNTDSIWELKVRRATRRRPLKTAPDAAVVKVELELPDSLFRPEVSITAAQVG